MPPPNTLSWNGGALGTGMVAMFASDRTHRLLGLLIILVIAAFMDINRSVKGQRTINIDGVAFGKSLAEALSPDKKQKERIKDVPKGGALNNALKRGIRR